jgi:hypothetical protein
MEKRGAAALDAPWQSPQGVAVSASSCAAHLPIRFPQSLVGAVQLRAAALDATWQSPPGRYSLWLMFLPHTADTSVFCI